MLNKIWKVALGKGGGWVKISRIEVGWWEWVGRERLLASGCEWQLRALVDSGRRVCSCEVLDRERMLWGGRVGVLGFWGII